MAEAAGIFGATRTGYRAGRALGRLRHLRSDYLVLQLAPRDLQRRPVAEHRQQILAQYRRALGAALLALEHFIDVFVDEILQRVGRLALREAFARRLLPLLPLLELRVFALLALQPLPCDSVPRLRERERPDLAQPDLAQRAIAGAVAIEEDLLPRSQTAHAQSRALGVTAFLAGLHVRDNCGGQGLRFFQCRFARHASPRKADLHRHLH